MKKRLISLLLTLSMVFSMVPMLGITTSARLSQISEETAVNNGLDYYIAWYHTSIEGKSDSYIWLRDLSEGFVHNILMSNGEYNYKIEEALAAWRTLNFSLTSETEYNDKEKALYESIIFDMMLGDTDNMVNNALEFTDSPTGENITNTIELFSSDLFVDFVNIIIGYLKDARVRDVNSFIMMLGMGDKTFKESVISCIQQAFDDIDKLDNTSVKTEQIKSICGIVKELVEEGIDILNAVNRSSKLESMIELEDAYMKVLLQMSICKGSDFASVDRAKQAAAEMWAICNSDYKNEINKMTWSEIFHNTSINGLNLITEELFEKLSEKLTPLGLIQKGQEIGKFAANLFVGTDNLEASLYGLQALSAIDVCLRQTANHYRTQFLTIQTKESAQAYNAAIKTWCRFALTANEYSKKHLDIVIGDGKINPNGIVNTIYGWFNQDTYDKYIELIEEQNELLATYLYEYDTTPTTYYYQYMDENPVYSIMYSADGATNVPGQQLKKDGTEITLSTQTPKKNNYSFIGWSVDKDDNDVEYRPGDTYSIDEDIVLFAVWSKDNTITYDAQKGTVSPSYSTYNAGESVTLPTPERTGYDFLGWSKTRTAASGVYKGGQTCKFDPGNLILYAIWKPKSFNVIFDAAGGKFPNAGSSTITKTKEYNQAFVIDIEEPVKTNCTFAEKWVHVNGTTGEIETYDHDALKVIYSIGDSTLDAKILTAVWNTDNTDNIPDAAAPSYTIQYNANVPEGVTVKNLPAAQSKTAGAAIALSSAKPTRTGYTFLGWNPDSSKTDANATYAPGELYAMDANLTLYAIWKQNTVAGTGIPGDINADKMVNNTDLIALRLYIDQKASKPLAVAEIGVDAEALDVNGNGKSAEEADFDTLMKYVSNWDIDIYYGTGEDINRYFTVTHSIQGDLLSAGTIEVWNGKATMTWNINSSHAWTAETTMTWCTFDEAGSKRSASGSAGQQELVIYLNDTQTSSSRTGNVKFTVDGEIYTITLKQQKAKLSVSHPDYPDVLTAQPIRLFNNSEAKMNLTVTSTHDWTVDVQNASSNWLTVKKTSDTNILITTNTYASSAKDNTADIRIIVNGDAYIIAVYQSAKPEPVTYLDAPTGVYVYAIDHESISVSWNSVNNAENYEVYRSTSSSSGYDCVATVTETEYIDTGLNEDTRYYYKIKACAGDIKSDYSSYDYDTTDEGTPISFSATHPDHGELVDAGNIEVFNGKASMTWTINSSHDWEAETSMSWCYFDSTRTERETSGSAGKSTLKIYLNDSQTSSKRTGKVRFTVNGEIFTVTLMQKKAQIEISHPDYPDVIDDQPIHLFNNANISMNWTVDSTHDWSASVLEASSNWIKVQKTSDTNLKLTTLSYASASQVNTATIVIYVNGDVYEIEIYQD